ncbi:MAG: M23 family metallopeptidase, partial [Angelakisella sp.]
KGAFPEQMQSVRSDLAAIISGDTDFRAVFAGLGQSISEGEPVLETLGTLLGEVMGEKTPTTHVAALAATPVYIEQKRLLARPVTAAELLTRNLGVQVDSVPRIEPSVSEPHLPAAEEPAIIHVDYTGPALPENATMDRYTLGLAKTASPVTAQVTSGFGWREHPLDGEEKFHNGVDLLVNDGTAVCAFADGVVDYIGESPVYGQYIQLRHANGVTTFYAHNSKLCVQQGQRVAVGEKITESGETGNVTGPHLHFEIKKDGKLLNPAYYIKVE